jgi:hypothetical protein
MASELAKCFYFCFRKRFGNRGGNVSCFHVSSPFKGGNRNNSLETVNGNLQGKGADAMNRQPNRALAGAYPDSDK